MNEADKHEVEVDITEKLRSLYKREQRLMRQVSNDKEVLKKNKAKLETTRKEIRDVLGEVATSEIPITLFNRPSVTGTKVGVDKFYRIEYKFEKKNGKDRVYALVFSEGDFNKGEHYQFVTIETFYEKFMGAKKPANIKQALKIVGEADQQMLRDWYYQVKEYRDDAEKEGRPTETEKYVTDLQNKYSFEWSKYYPTEESTHYTIKIMDMSQDSQGSVLIDLEDLFNIILSNEVNDPLCIDANNRKEAFSLDNIQDFVIGWLMKATATQLGIYFKIAKQASSQNNVVPIGLLEVGTGDTAEASPVEPAQAEPPQEEPIKETQKGRFMARVIEDGDGIISFNGVDKKTPKNLVEAIQGSGHKCKINGRFQTIQGQFHTLSQEELEHLYTKSSIFVESKKSKSKRKGEAA